MVSVIGLIFPITALTLHIKKHYAPVISGAISFRKTALNARAPPSIPQPTARTRRVAVADRPDGHRRNQNALKISKSGSDIIVQTS